MVEAGIADPDSQEGKDFCTDRCPYEKCIVFELTGTDSPAASRKRKRIADAKQLWEDCWSKREIARKLGVSRRTVEKYLE